MRWPHNRACLSRCLHGPRVRVPHLSCFLSVERALQSGSCPYTHHHTMLGAALRTVEIHPARELQIREGERVRVTVSELKHPDSVNCRLTHSQASTPRPWGSAATRRGGHQHRDASHRLTVRSRSPGSAGCLPGVMRCLWRPDRGRVPVSVIHLRT